MTAAARKFGGGVRPAIAKVKIAVKDLRIADDDYRAMLFRLTGKTSSTDCTDAQLGLLLDELKAKGWKPKAGPKAALTGGKRTRQAQSALAMKARAMWISLHQLGVIEDPSESALETYARRMLKVDRLEWARPEQAAVLIEGLKAMAERAGWSQDVSGVPAAERVAVLKARLADLIAAQGDAR